MIKLGKTAGQLIQGLRGAVAQKNKEEIERYSGMLRQLQDITGQSTITGIFRKVKRPESDAWPGVEKD